MRLQLIRVISLGITGYDAPSLKTGVMEAKVSLEIIRDVLSNSFKQKNLTDSVDFYLNHSIQYLNDYKEFDSFDRMHFLTRYALPLQTHFGKLTRDLKLEINTHGALNYQAKHIFSPDAFDKKFFSSSKKNPSPAEIALGKKLFFDKRLSGDNGRSCATCHNPALHFSDGLPKSIGFQSNTFVKRNAPSLLYAGFQHNQFWDGRSKTLEKQIETVIKDPAEMHGNMAMIMKKLSADKSYLNTFHKAFHQKPGEKIREKQVYQAVAAYVGTLSPFNSRFDHYMNGDAKALTENEIHGFNVFMGKGQCGTCHFAPLFNGLIPPAYKLTEFEILGTPANDQLDAASIDGDDGRFSFFQIQFYKNAFKTPTVRNAAVTAPYMHNGGFKTLEAVIDFYDRGGGAGLGLDFPNQTLSSARLNLTDQEKQDIIAFLHTLTDHL
ncbi:cytochrome C peroxidase [Dyadobacter luticola]|uniref:Cytochrome C peroxidase n=2 Tax=Dyadobacter luticola TaxID=1979387 RepID=A0A5R9L688_9BACT|nr:cytochrome C peroxidase [Dyadobacter luticola]